MPVLTCPHCAAAIEVATSRAGSQVTCAQCQGSVAVPNLGELRQLQADRLAASSASTAAAANALQHDEAAVPWRAAFTALAVVTAVSLLLAGYCGMRWAASEVPVTMQQHLSEIAEAYQHAPPAELIHDWERLETYRPEFAGPYQYQAAADARAAWLHKALFGGGVAVLAGATALFAGSRARARDARN